MLCCPHCSMLSTILFSIVTPDCGLIHDHQYWTILLTTINNVGSTTLFKAVFINPEQVVRFLLCKCTLFRTEVTHLGCVVSKRRVTADPVKVQAVVNWPRPSNTHEVRSFYYWPMFLLPSFCTWICPTGQTTSCIERRRKTIWPKHQCWPTQILINLSYWMQTLVT